jgi:IS605 OrfB family transposase
MKVIRATKASLKFATQHKRDELRRVLPEYAKVVNFFINEFWDELPRKQDLKVGVYSKPASITWLSATMCQVAAREAIDMVKASKERHGDKAVMPTHKGKRMCLSAQVVKVGEAKTEDFDLWLTFTALAADKSVKFSIPVKKHKHFNRLEKKGRLQQNFVVSESGIQFSFEIETGEKREGNQAMGLDTGIKALGTLSNGKQYGRDIEDCIKRCKRCKWGSEGHKTAQRALKQKINEVAKTIFAKEQFDLLVIEDLSDMNHKSKQRRRLCKSMRRSLGIWNWRKWLERLKMLAEANCIRYRVVPPQYTSQSCRQCGHVERGNRSGERFKCRKCGYACNADINAAQNILERFTLGIYGSQYKGIYPSVSGSQAPPPFYSGAALGRT